jgi:hypothetical protein
MSLQRRGVRSADYLRPHKGLWGQLQQLRPLSAQPVVLQAQRLRLRHVSEIQSFGKTFKS